MKKNILYLQSGGPTSVINSSLYGFVSFALEEDGIDGIYGAKFGIEGVLAGDFVNLREISKEDLSLLKQTPDMYLGSSRKNLSPDLSSDEYQKILKNLKERRIDAVFVNGGNDSMLTADRLYRFLKDSSSNVKVFGIPKTIDNDLCGFDHTLGFPSAALHLLSLVKCIAIDGMSYKKGKIQLVEAMGRDTGWLAASSDMLPSPYHPDFILIPEYKFDEEMFYKKLEEIYSKKGHALVVLSEGVNPCASLEKDPFGHENLEGAANIWDKAIRKKLGHKTRTTILSSPMRSDPVLASQIDIDEAVMAAKEAIMYFEKGLNGVVPAIVRASDSPYRSSFSPISLDKVAGVVRYIPNEYLCDLTKMSDSFREYMKPLLKKRDILTDEQGLFLSAKPLR